MERQDSRKNLPRAVCAQLSLDSWLKAGGECRNGIKKSAAWVRRRTPRDGTDAATRRLLSQLASSRVSASQWDCVIDRTAQICLEGERGGEFNKIAINIRWWCC
ncbi:hypothetical protein B0T18DRAFT_60611 [Schizothecium vesticola]|uniref:Uncharacterized protein n=1 Tax=Schizothecium vesticola TaxID=314040 RepID=A0AA40K9N1_9PEZI|nr:hypothetical protein B0T18DRAFT_60611 [Schizothecium vesticola]